MEVKHSIGYRQTVASQAESAGHLKPAWSPGRRASFFVRPDGGDRYAGQGAQLGSWARSPGTGRRRPRRAAVVLALLGRYLGRSLPWAGVTVAGGAVAVVYVAIVYVQVIRSEEHT